MQRGSTLSTVSISISVPGEAAGLGRLGVQYGAQGIHTVNGIFFTKTCFPADILSLTLLDHTRRRMVHGDHYITGNGPGVGSDWDFM